MGNSRGVLKADCEHPTAAVGGGVEDVYGQDSATKDRSITPLFVLVQDRAVIQVLDQGATMRHTFLEAGAFSNPPNLRRNASSSTDMEELATKCLKKS
ncbi:hypothetical protein M8C21_007490, partial [Ambrosia artemisiifolia]